MNDTPEYDGPQDDVEFRRATRGAGYESISRDMLQNDGLSFRARGLLAMMLSMPNTWVFHGIRQIERMGTEGREAVRSTLRELEDHGLLIRRSRRKPGTTNGWQWLWVWGDNRVDVAADLAAAGWPPASGVRQPVVPTSGVREPGVRQPVVPKPVPVRGLTPERSTEDKEPPQPPAGGGRRATTSPARRSADTEAFDRFWAAYPLRTGKDAARRAWAKAVSRGTHPDDIVKASLRFGQAWDRDDADRDYIPHPSTWLNQGRYEDEEPQVRIDRAARPAISKLDQKIIRWQSMKRGDGPPGPPSRQGRLSRGDQRELDA